MESGYERMERELAAVKRVAEEARVAAEEARRIAEEARATAEEARVAAEEAKRASQEGFGVKTGPGRGWRRNPDKAVFLGAALKLVEADPERNVRKAAERMWMRGCPYSSCKSLENAMYLMRKRALRSGARR